jgi:hypothetical protein
MSDIDNIEVCACGFNADQCAHKQEVGGCRQDDEQPAPSTPRDEPPTYSISVEFTRDNATKARTNWTRLGYLSQAIEDAQKYARNQIAVGGKITRVAILLCEATEAEPAKPGQGEG